LRNAVQKIINIILIIWDDAILIISTDSYHYAFAFYQLAGWPQLFLEN
jgi:hypothetical protein